MVIGFIKSIVLTCKKGMAYDTLFKEFNNLLKIISTERERFTKTINDLEKENLLLNNDLLTCSEENKKLTEKLKVLNKQLSKSTNSLEKYWNSKIKPMFITYPARNGKRIDVRKFFTEHNSSVKTFTSGSNDQKALYCHKWVTSNVHYKTDKQTHNANEFWQFADETMDSLSGDCEDGAILMANMMVKSGIPYWRVRVNAGDVKGGGHAYVTYLREKDNKWYILDWCYWANESIGFKKTWSSAKKYWGIWFSFNKKYSFAKDKLDRK